jgi:hypothetical protein
MLRDNLVGLIEPMPTPRQKSGSSLALGIPKQRQVSDDRSSCLENPRPEGAESALTERLLLHFRLNQDKTSTASIYSRRTCCLASFLTCLINSSIESESSTANAGLHSDHRKSSYNLENSIICFAMMQPWRDQSPGFTQD